MSAALGGTLIGSATRAFADTPKRGGRIKAAGYSSGTTDTLDPAKAALHRLRPVHELLQWPHPDRPGRHG
jgi:hypothetical protein